MSQAAPETAEQAKTLHLYIDDSGSRYPDHEPAEARDDGMNYFALGGVLIRQEDISAVFASHKVFTEKWKLVAPLHSTKIRGRRKAFSWLNTDKDRAAQFFNELDQLILSLPIIAMACVIDRPGYVKRYAGKHQEPWLLCKTALSILIERSAKYASLQDRRLEIYFEESGKHEDRALQSYVKELKSSGMPFDGSKEAGYESMAAEVFRKTLKGEPNRITKAVPMVQFADLVLYALSKGGYDTEYPPFKALHEHNLVLDKLMPARDISRLGVKYSCFDTTKARVAPSP